MRLRLATLGLATLALGSLGLPEAPRAAYPPLSTDGLFGSFRLARSGMVVTIADCAGRLCGRVTAVGSLPPVDKRNPVPAQQSRRLCGLPVLTGFTAGATGWHAILYDPENGTNYTLTLSPGERGSLSVEGRWGMPVMTRSMRRPVETWERVFGTVAQACDGSAPVS
jgi:hypothetical protein